MPGADPPRECDVAVLRAGIVGLAAARELGRVTTVCGWSCSNNESGIATHQSDQTSGVVHRMRT